MSSGRRWRPAICPEHPLRAQLLQVFYSIRSERLLMEQLDYNLLFRARIDWLFVFASAAFNLIRLPKLLPRPA